jgi:hypothetical protein
MAPATQRLRYFDGEFLRGGDLTDEQTYHLSMRRALSLGLHSAGIVKGLVIQQDADSLPPDLLFFSVSPGLAIDQDGREIVVSAPYLLSADNVLKRAGLVAGDSEAWIVYSEAATGLPSAGDIRCDEAGQNTRIAEGFEVLLKPKGVPLAKGAKDPDAELRGIRIGTVTLKNDAINGWTITAADSVGRTYAGIRAQSIVAPDEVDTDSFAITAQNVTPAAAGKTALAPPGYLDINPGVFARGNAFVEGSLVVGDDFKLDNAVFPKLPPPASIPPNGNLKLKGDLFLNGAFYGFLNGTWLGLGDYIRGLIPDVQTGFQDFDLSNPGGATTGSAKVSLNTQLAGFKNPPQFSVAIAGFRLLSNKNFTGMQAGHPNDVVQVQASAIATPTGTQSLDLDVTWTVGPSFVLGGQQALPLGQIRISWIVIFTPGP